MNFENFPAYLLESVFVVIFCIRKSVQSIWSKLKRNSRFLKHDIVACTNRHNLYVRISRIPRQYPFALIRDEILRQLINRRFSDRTTTSKWTNRTHFFLRETIRWFRSTSTEHTCSILGLGKESNLYGAQRNELLEVYFKFENSRNIFKNLSR